jgi:hypothetical protein
MQLVSSIVPSHSVVRICMDKDLSNGAEEMDGVPPTPFRRIVLSSRMRQVTGAGCPVGQNGTSMRESSRQPTS